MPDLQDPSFYKSVTYLCQHDDQGGLGVVINQPLAMSFTELFSALDIDLIDTSIASRTVLSGGPVSLNQGFVLHTNTKHKWEHSLVINQHLSLSSSKDILESIAIGEGPEDFLILLGYSGWSEGQLEKEIAQNSWLTHPSDKDIIFKLPFKERWHAAANLMGFDINLMSKDIGHA
ncbi:MAG: YqgE/AlgH family protein [Gammaproteobacteria bacterium]|nr:YqgE/AlgH family protein [Gammaproteobacteria bacterium]